jgi:phosphoadenosine phosphosulfate reductase
MTNHTANNQSELTSRVFLREAADSVALPLLGVAARYRAQFQSLDITERISKVLTDFPTATVATTSGGIQSGFLLAHLAKLQRSSYEDIRLAVEKLPIIFIDTGDLFQETVDYITDLRRYLGLNIIRYRHNLSDEELQVNLTALTAGGLTPQSAFDELTKVRPMKAILAQYGAKAWIAGNRRDQSGSRSTLPYATVQNDILKIYPIADVQSESVRTSLTDLGIPPHPLVGRYRSVGNRSDTKNVEGPFEKSGRHAGLKEECGLHEAWANRGKTLLKSGRGFIPCTQMPVREVEI